MRPSMRAGMPSRRSSASTVLADFLQEFLVGMAPRFDGAHDFLVRVGLQVLERQVFQLAAHFAHPQAVRDGRVDFDGLAGDALAPLGAQIAQRAHVVHAVGQLDHDDADILHHGQQHLAEALGLAVFGRVEIELGQLGDAVHAARHFVAEFLAHLLDGDAGVFHHVVQQAGLHGHHVHAHVGQDVRHHERMHHVRLAGIAALPLVVFEGEAEGLFERRQVVFGTVLADLGHQLAIQLFHRIGGGGGGTAPGRLTDSEATVLSIVAGAGKLRGSQAPTGARSRASRWRDVGVPRGPGGPPTPRVIHFAISTAPFNAAILPSASWTTIRAR